MVALFSLFYFSPKRKGLEWDRWRSKSGIGRVKQRGCGYVCVKGPRWTVGRAEGEGGLEGLWRSAGKMRIWVSLDRCCLCLNEEIQQITQCALNPEHHPLHIHFPEFHQKSKIKICI